MYCPKCAAQNIEGASFCRVCGANIRLVPQALTGQLHERETDDLARRRGRSSRRGYREPPSLEKGIVNLFIGMGFLLAALFVTFRFPAGMFWGWTLFFPAFDRIGRGIAAIVAANKQPPARLSSDSNPAYIAPPVREANQVEPKVRRTGELIASPPSVTENTTRHLGAEAPTRTLDSQSDYPK